MIALVCARLPRDAGAADLKKRVAECFPHLKNAEYFERLCDGKNDEGIKESLFALVTLRRAISLLPEKVECDKLIFSKELGGKPYFEGSEVRFSLSHSKGCVACAAAYGEEVGIDLESAAPSPDKAIKLAKRFFTEADAELVKADPDVFSRIWSEKEAEAKFYGKELSLFLKEQRTHQNNQDFAKSPRAGTSHKFKMYSIPISLFTKSNYSTIIFVSDQ